MGKFIDFDKTKKIFYDNIYFDDVKLVVKIPIIPKKTIRKEIKIEKFDLTKYTYLIAHD